MSATTLSHQMGPTSPPLLDTTIGDQLLVTVAGHRDREALVVRHQGIRQTYGELLESVDRLARGLMSAGIDKGDRVGIWSPNCAEWVHLQFATARIGAILVTLNPAYRTTEVEYALRQSGCKMVVAAPSYLTSDYAAMLDEVSAGLPALDHVLFIGSPEWRDIAGGSGSATPDDLAVRAASLVPDEAINIQYTSGTTGFPKGATLTHRNILNNGYFVGVRCGYTPEDRVCIPVPLYHCFGMVMGDLGAITHGAAMVLPCPTFDPEAVLRAVAEERCTSLYGVPTMFIAELAHPLLGDLDLSSLRTGIMAGSPCPVEVMKRVIAEMNMAEVTICYGMTETSPVSTQTTTDDDLERRVSTVGTVHPHVEVKIVDPATGETVAREGAGELCTRGYSVMLGYWDDTARTAEAVDTDGWMHTGDLATMDADGYINIVGRIKDMIIRGGENIYPREIEEFLYRHPDIEDVQVIGVPDERYGEELMAWVRLRDGATITPDEIRDYCRGKIAHFKVPRYVKAVEAFPMTVTGKIQKYKMRQEAIAELGLADAAATRTA
jgi:fatty-acyl-CoA synthase